MDTSNTEVIEGEVVKPRKRRKDAKIRDKMFVTELISNGGNATKAAMAVTGATNKKSASVMGAQLKKRNELAIQERMDNYGLTEKRVVERHKELLESDNEPVAAKMVDTYYKVTKKEEDKDSNITVHFHY